MNTSVTGTIKIIDTYLYSNLKAAEGSTVACTIRVHSCVRVYYVEPSEFSKLGCDVGTCELPYIFYPQEVEDLTLNICKGENCMVVDGVNHSKECIKNHNAIYDKIRVGK